MGQCVSFAAWCESNLQFNLRTANRYISLYKYRAEISRAENLIEAYKLIGTLEAQKKQTEAQSANQRVQTYIKTGHKPEGWRRGTDDKLAQEEKDRIARIEAAKQEALKNQQERTAAEKKRAEEEAQLKASIKQREEEMDRIRKENENIDTSGFADVLKRQAENIDKRNRFKESIRLSSEGGNEPFMDALIDYLEGLEDDNRRIEACSNIIKICRGIANQLQSKRKTS